MASRLTFYEVQREIKKDCFVQICLCKKEEDAKRIATTEESLSGNKHCVMKVEISAKVELTIRGY